MARAHERRIAIFESESGNVQLEIDPEHETVWATQQEIADAFGCSAENVRQHISNICSEGELSETATSKNILEVQKEGARDVRRQVNHYNLDLILSVSYRVSSQRATIFRQWATETLKRWLVEGYALNPERVEASPDIQRRLAAVLRQIRTSATPSLNLVRILALCILSLTFMAGCASSDENVSNSGPGTREIETTGQAVSEPDYTDPPTAVLVAVGPETDRSLTPQQAAALEQAIEDAGSLVNVIEACAAAQNDRPP